MSTTLLSFYIIIKSISASIIPYSYSSLPIGSITPLGWLDTQLQLQANGLTGHLSEFWHGVQNSSWIQPNGTGDNELEEFTPYWLNGIIPLHFLLPNNTALHSQSWKYISYILSHQSSNGWLGTDNISNGNQYWARWNILNAFRMYCEGNITMCATLKTSMLKYILQQEYRMNNISFGNTWSGARWMDFVLSSIWLYENGGNIINGYQQNLIDVIQLSYEQGFNWEYYFEYQLPKHPISNNQSNYYNQGVNCAQAFKSAAVWYRFSGGLNETLRNLSLSRLIKMDIYHGQATGMFGADGHLAGRMPSTGTETCTVVEYMWSFQIMFRVFGNVKYLDRLERISINALSATFGSPIGGDMWAHQYFQQGNEINSMYTQPHIWANNNGPYCTVYGLAPNYGCCTANFNQGWPKFASAIYFTLENAIAIGIYAPSKTNGVINNMASLNISTNYPFQDDINIFVNAIKSFDLYLRIPHWVNSGDVILKFDNKEINSNLILNGTMYKLNIATIGNHEIYLNFNPNIRIYGGYNGSISLLRGSLLFSFQIKEEWEITETYAFDSKDYWCLPVSAWNYALNISDVNNINKYVQIKTFPWVNGHAPFNRTNIPIKLLLYANIVNTWISIDSAAGPPPKSPACQPITNCQKNSQQIELIPHGMTDLRIAEFPLAFTKYE
eukprot:128688_1